MQNQLNELNQCLSHSLLLVDCRYSDFKNLSDEVKTQMTDKIELSVELAAIYKEVILQLKNFTRTLGQIQTLIEELISQHKSLPVNMSGKYTYRLRALISANDKIKSLA